MQLSILEKDFERALHITLRFVLVLVVVVVLTATFAEARLMSFFI